MTPQDWIDIVERVKSSRLDDWHSYQYETERQSLTSLCLQHGLFDVNINRIRHGKGGHCHACNVVSLVLMGGYGHWLRQAGATAERYQFAAPGSLVILGPEDAHRIPELARPSLSLFVADRHFDWHLHYLPARIEVATEMLIDAKFALFNQVPVPELKVAE